MSTSDGSTADYYQLPPGSTELQHLISHRDMNAQIGEIFRACYRYGIASHSSRLRDAKKIRFYIEAEIARLEALEGKIPCDKPVSCEPCGSTVPGWHKATCPVGGLAAFAQHMQRADAVAKPCDSDPLGQRGYAEPAAPKLFSELCAEVDALIKPELEKMLEPAAQIDDESDRQQAVAQNGNDGLVYEDPWYGAPEWARFKAQDEDGRTHFYQDRPEPGSVHWVVEDGDFEEADIPPPRNPNWRDTLIERTSD